MNRRTFCLQTGISLASLMALAQKPATPTTESSPAPMPADRGEDSYEIFSLLIPVLQDESPTPRECGKTSRPAKKNGYLISDTTADPGRLAFPRTPVAETKPPMGAQGFFAHLDPMDVPDRQVAQFNEAVVDYASRKGERVQLEPKFSLPLPYRLMSVNEVSEYAQLSVPHISDPSHPWPPNRGLVKKYKGWGPLSRMSEVYFDHARVLGLVWAERNNGCMDWYAFEKQDGQWRPAAWKDRKVCEQA
jgi:hypothetical protein